MEDSFQRNIDYLRISVTDRCNFRCSYCMPQEGFVPMEHSSLLTYEEIERLCTVFAELGINKIKLTGGEPLARKGLAFLVEKIHRIDGIQKVTMTTNGSLLGAEQAKELREAGLDGINISLDTLKPEVFKKVTDKDLLPQVLEAIRHAVTAGIPMVKINCVPIRGVNDAELTAIAALAKSLPLEVRFIEMMPIGKGKSSDGIKEEELINILEAAYGPMKLVKQRLGNGPATYYSLNGFVGHIGFISAVTHRFCGMCNRIRLTSDGILKPCLQYAGIINLRDLMRTGATNQELRNAICEVILKKPKGHHFSENYNETECLEERVMTRIGG